MLDGVVGRARRRAVPADQQVVFASVIVWLVILWSYVWKLMAFWKAARRDHIGWYVIFALPIPFGFFEMLYVFWVAPRYPELDQSVM
ncbi:MAG TPA: DUF5652 family protein [Phycisphaerae bacterium]|nr:DUF5652 family protein [Phycisphaerae bacterium]